MENFLEINKWVYPFIRDLRVKFVDSHFPLSTPHFFPVHKLFDKLFPKFKPAFFSETKNQQFPITGSLIGSLNQELTLIANYSCIKLCKIFIPLYSTLYCDFIVQGIYLVSKYGRQCTLVVFLTTRCQTVANCVKYRPNL